MFDVVVVGGGPAGMSAALILGRSRRRALLLDAGDGRNAPSRQIHNLLTRDGTPPAEYRRLGLADLATYPTVEVRSGTVASVDGAADGFHLELSDGDTVSARRLLLATGMRDELPDIEGVGGLWGRTAIHCPYCHGYEFADRPIAVVGAGPNHARLAIHARRLSDDVVLCLNGERPESGALRVLRENHVAVRRERITRLEGTDGQLQKIVFADGPALARDAVFVPTVYHQRSDLAAQLGCAMFPDGAVEVTEFGTTSVPGVSAAGDMARRSTVPMPIAAVSAAGASGTIAAVGLDQDLLSQDASLPSRH